MNIFHIDVSGDANTEVLCRYTSRDDDCKNIICRDINIDGRKIPFLRDIGRDNSRCTTIEMP